MDVKLTIHVQKFPVPTPTEIMYDRMADAKNNWWM
jgi:hypothetical protein